MGDKAWAALFDNTKIKEAVGAFHCAKDLAEVLAEPIASVPAPGSKRKGPRTTDLDPLMDLIAREQMSLGPSTG